MEAAQAIALVSDYIRSRGLDYPSEGLEAVPFDAGWRVYAPGDIDESDPMAFLDMPVGRSVFLVGDSGRIEETSTSIPPRQAHEQFMEHESRAGPANGASGDNPPEDATREQHTLNLSDDAPVAAQASRLLDPIVQQLAQLGPQDWERFSAAFAFTVSAEVAQLRFWSNDQAGMVPVPSRSPNWSGSNEKSRLRCQPDRGGGCC